MLSNCFKAEEMETRKVALDSPLCKTSSRAESLWMINALMAALMMPGSAPLLFGDGVTAKQTENSVVQIAVAMPGGSITNFGTGFFIRDDGLIATASHVYLKALDAIVDARGGVVIVRRFSRTTRGQWVGARVPNNYSNW
jgi:hypothetical protein